MCRQAPLNWLTLLDQAVQASSCTEVARLLGISRSAVSLCLAGKYPGSTTRMEQRVLAALGGHICPQSGLRVPISQCQRRRAEAMPTANPHVLQHWRACAACQHFNYYGG